MSSSNEVRLLDREFDLLILNGNEYFKSFIPEKHIRIAFRYFRQSRVWLSVSISTSFSTK